jgi:signal transduction histidine kinase
MLIESGVALGIMAVASVGLGWLMAGRVLSPLRTITAADLGTAPALGDSRLAERLAANLADNAIRYNVAGGKVEISTGDRDGRAFLAVSNTGPVIPPDQLGRLFQPFQRLDPGRGGPERGGLGLGLAIVGAIAAAHGAELRAVTRAVGGLTVEVVFPPVPAGASRRAQEHDGERERVAAPA